MTSSKKIRTLILSIFLSIPLDGYLNLGLASDYAPITIYFGYVTQVHCKGRLFLSSVGNIKLVRREAFPKEMGCGVLIQPEEESGRTDLLLKTSIGDFHRIIE